MFLTIFIFCSFIFSSTHRASLSPTEHLCLPQSISVSHRAPLFFDIKLTGIYVFPLYSHVFLHIFSENHGRPRAISFRIAPRLARKNSAFLGTTISFRMPCWAEIKKNLPQIPSPKNTISFRLPFWREIKKSLVLCSPNPFYISFVK